MTEEKQTDGAMIESVGLSKFYGDFAAVQDISFSVPRGQVCAFLGPNGAGKSTTMKMLTGFLAPNDGTARIAGFDIDFLAFVHPAPELLAVIGGNVQILGE